MLKGVSLVKLIENLKELYKGENILNKHICLACISAITGLLTDNDFFKAIIAQNNFVVGLLAIIAAAAGALYMFGYTIETVHSRLQAGIALLPEITGQPYKRIIGMMLIMLVWLVYACFILVLLTTLVFLIPAIKLFIIALMVIYFLFVPYVYVAYAKNFKAFGLMNIMLPLKFMKKSFVDTIILSLKFTLLFIIVCIPVILIYMAFTPLGRTVSMGVLSCLVGYVTFVMQLLWYVCLADIYEEKLQDEVEELY